MKNHIKKYFITILGLIGILSTNHVYGNESLTERYNIAYITMNEGLPHHFIDDIYRDSYGFIWISMGGGGLSRYDGYDFVNFHPNNPTCKLKSNFIRKVCEDRFHRLWAVSEGGIDIIDLNTLQEIPLLSQHPITKDITKKPSSHVICDSNGCIWLHSYDTIYRICFDLDGNISQTQKLTVPSVFHGYVFKDLDHNGSIWISIDNQLCNIHIDGKGHLKATPITGCPAFPYNTSIADMTEKENEIWIATNNGLYRYNRNENIVKHYSHNTEDANSLSQNYLTSLAITPDKQLMVASLKGIHIYNPIQDNFYRIKQRNSDTGNNLLNSDFINCMLVEGRHIWIGTESGGINKLTTKRQAIINYQNDKDNPKTLSPNPVNAIYEDKYGTLWVGTVEGGLNRKSQQDNTFTHFTQQNGTINHNSVSALTADKQDRLWVGTWGGGITLLDLKQPQRKLKVLFTEKGAPYPIDFVGALTYDSINNGMWIGANQGVYFYDITTDQLTSPLPQQAAEKIRGSIGSIIDKDQQLWMGCMEGVYIIDLKSRKQANGTFSYRHLKYKLNDPSCELIEKITCFHETKDGTLWLGSNGNGLYKRTVSKSGQETFTNYTTDNGLSSNSIRGIQEDDKGCLWIASNKGLSHMILPGECFINYDQQDGLANAQFYWNATCRSKNHILYFGHMEGLSAIGNELPLPDIQPTDIRFTRLIVENEEIKSGTDLLKKDISVTQEITLHESSKSFSVEFSALHFETDHTAAYSYRLIGFDKHWIQLPSNRRFVSYTNLSAGTYTLQVKYQSADDSQAEKIAELKIIIKPYFYKTIWFALIILLIIGIFIQQFYQWRIRSYKKQRELLHQKVEQRTYELNQQKQLLEQNAHELFLQNERLKEQNEKIKRQRTQLARMTRKVQELTLDKIAFFTNITHEFRTPITLIIGPIERALKLSYNPQVIEQLHFVERNSKYLLSLVNQLMDFRKLESGKLEIVKNKNNFRKFANELIIPFSVFAKERNIELRCYYRLTADVISYDEEAMHKVLTNLLSNAIKFTPNGGIVSLYIALMPVTNSQQATLYINVRDTGGGIPTEDIDQIFNRFYQSKGQTKYPMYGQAGTGIGLYLCKRIIEMQGGKIYAKNNLTGGCSIRILLPLTPEEIGEQENTLLIPAPTATPSLPASSNEISPKDITILVVEDNADMRSYIRSILQDNYQVKEAANGSEALNVLHSQHIDFIISDLMMPIMDGIELSRRVKEDINISHIPFLMLTAKTSQDTRIESYRMGVDEYLLKPFDEDLLLTRIENILQNRKRYQQKFAINMDVEALNMTEESGDKKFLNRVMEVIKTHYKDSSFEVANFCEAVGVSKTLLNQKLQSLVGQSAGQFIRNYRLNLARELLLKKKGLKNISVSEIAYEVGFNDPKYFTRCFTKEFNIKPSELLNH